MTDPVREGWWQDGLGPAGHDLVRRDADAFLHQTGSSPVVSALRAVDGIWLEDADGRRIMDFHGNSCHNIGYGHPAVIAALKAQLDTLPFCPRRFTNAPATELAERLSALWPHGPARILFGTSGTDAIEMAVKLAYVATGRKTTLAFEDTWHGAALGAVWIGGRARERAAFPEFQGCVHVPPYWSREPGISADDAASASLQALREAFGRDGGFAAMLAEPIRSTPHRPPDWFWPEVRDLCDHTGTLLIFDEVAVGLGKTGRLYAGEHFPVRPDMTVLGKSLGGAVVPLSAVIARADLNVAGHLAIGHYTHEKSPLLAAAGLATLRVLVDQALADKAQALGGAALSRLQNLAARSGLLCGARGVGLLMALDFAPEARNLAPSVQLDCLRRGLNATVSEGRFLTLSPPLVIDPADLDRAIDIVEAALDRLCP
ncbi:MAG: aminotransferase class III-fold pyridoxal phosphate-dependent enzyme [Rhodospirillaceae bacterium]|nr:aminotransferase class III-fold pyridoxal phosphate-dependent enzyme [Rhodospirillaceae bacterium]